MSGVFVAPTDAQLRYIRDLCREHGLPPVPVYSNAHAQLVIGELRAGLYDPARGNLVRL